MRDILYCSAIVVLLAVIFSRRDAGQVAVTTTADTVYMRDTVREVIPEPRTVYVARVDTVKVYLPVENAAVMDAVEVSVPVPIEEKEYRTDNFHAVVSGYRPQLVSLELFPETKTVYVNETRHTVRRTRFGVGIQAGYGLSGGRYAPYIGVGVQYNLWGW